MSVRNVGNGMAVIEAWPPFAGQLTGEGGWGEIGEFRPRTRAIWVPPREMIRREDDGDGDGWWTSLARHHTLDPE
jgi:hypothetical protein